jgi:ATP-binding cassette subfamily B protein
MRFYDPDRGAIAIDGVDLRHGSQDSLRSQMGCVFQESFLFNTSVRENIRLGRRDATDAEIEAAARAAEIHDGILALPQGYDTVVGERGGRVSGGQRQRIAIARAILRHPEILILDEATSALDPATEAAINTTLGALARGRTSLMVTHRLASIVDADHIVVLEGGRVCEEGRHAELLARHGLYRRLWDKQSGFALTDGGDRATVTAERLRAIPIFRELEHHLLEESASLFGTDQHPADRIVAQEGDVGHHMYIVVHGTVEVVKRTPEGGSARVAILQDGDHFGEIALLRAVPRTATVRTLTPCVFLTLRRERFDDLLGKAPALRGKLEAIVGQRAAREAVASAARRDRA